MTFMDLIPRKIYSTHSSSRIKVDGRVNGRINWSRIRSWIKDVAIHEEPAVYKNI